MNVNMHGIKSLDTTMVKNRLDTICREILENNGNRKKMAFDLPVSRKNNDQGIPSGVYSKMDITIHYMDGYIPKRIRDELNCLNYGHGYYTQGDYYIYDNVAFKKEAIPAVEIKSLQEVKAQDNYLNFGSHEYFKYRAKDGKEYPLQVGSMIGNGIGEIYTEYLRGNDSAYYDKQCQDYLKFWNGVMVNTGPDIPGLFFNRSEAKAFMEEAGIEHGFFTVKMSDSVKTFYYSSNTTSRMIETQKSYDIRYASLTNSSYNLLTDFEPGSIFKIGDKEYVLKEDFTLDVEYGADIFALILPERESL
ncbi:MAG: hypothetical protein K2K70_00295 [Lachnospiraceae bacterium]|nr:hypothetical protein [Lachnospiraceae bacterium]